MNTENKSTVIHVDEDTSKERRRQRNEFFLALLLLISILVGVWLQLFFYGVDSWFFIALLNVNGILMFIIMLLVVRSTIKLIMERRRKVFGARMRTRLVIFFVSISLFPAVIMFLASNRVVATSVDYWFTRQTEGSLQAALDVGRNFYTAAAGRLRIQAENILEQINIRHLPPGSDSMKKLFAEKYREYGLIALGIVTPKEISSIWQGTEDFYKVWREISHNVNWEHVAANSFSSTLWATDKADYVIGVLAIDNGKKGYLLAAESIGQGLMNQMERISRGFEEYANLKQFKEPLKLSFLLILGILALVTIFASIWMAFRLSRQISAPILALAEGTDRIAKGDLNLRLEDSGKDELGLLVQSFNRMTSDLQQSRERLTQVNKMLNQRNNTVAERNMYIEAVLDSIATGVITLDEKGHFLTINKAACSIFRVRPKDIIGLDPLGILPPAYTEVFISMVQTLRENPDKDWIRQIDFVLAGRSLKLVIHAVALSSPKGIQAFLVVIEDITELGRMQRLAAWREVARRIAHEIKNPLTPIKLSTERLKKRFGKNITDPVFGESTDLIVRQVERMQRMVQEFSDFAKLPEIILARGDIGPVIEEGVNLFRSSHGQFDWILHMQEAMPAIYLDKEGLHRVFVNLFANAAEALSIKAETAPDNWKGIIEISTRCDTEAGRLLVFIKDNGPGLPKEDQEEIFEPYYSKKPGGVGLGLTIVRAVLAEHKAFVEVKSAPDEGATFCLSFQIAPKL